MKLFSIGPVGRGRRSLTVATATWTKPAGALLAATFLLTAPAGAQTLADSFRQLKESVRQLGAKRPVASQSAVPAGIPAPAADQAAGRSEDTEVVPATSLAEDMSDTSLERLTITRRRVESFDILGFKLGMSPREVGRIARKQGIRRQWNTIFQMTGSFEVEATGLANAQLNEMISKRSRSYIKTTGGLTPNGSSILFTFTLEPSGPKLSQIDCNAKRDGMAEAELLASLERKYGPRDAGTSDIIWTNGAATARGRDGGARMFVSVDGTTVDMSLRAPGDYVFAARKRLEDRAQEIARAKGGGVRF